MPRVAVPPVIVTVTVRGVNSVPLTMIAGRFAEATDSTPEAVAPLNSTNGLRLMRMSSRKLPYEPASEVVNWTRCIPDGPE